MWEEVKQQHEDEGQYVDDEEHELHQHHFPEDITKSLTGNILWGGEAPVKDAQRRAGVSRSARAEQARPRH